MKRARAAKILDERIGRQNWEQYPSTILPDGPKVRVSEILIKSFPEAEPGTLIKDLGDSAVSVWLGLEDQAGFRDESPEAEVRQESVTLKGTKTKTTATGSLVFHKGELWLSSSRLL
jgi:hypothetical protein